MKDGTNPVARNQTVLGMQLKLLLLSDEQLQFGHSLIRSSQKRKVLSKNLTLKNALKRCSLKNATLNIVMNYLLSSVTESINQPHDSQIKLDHLLSISQSLNPLVPGDR